MEQQLENLVWNNINGVVSAMLIGELSFVNLLYLLRSLMGYTHYCPPFSRSPFINIPELNVLEFACLYKLTETGVNRNWTPTYDEFKHLYATIWRTR